MEYSETMDMAVERVCARAQALAKYFPDRRSAIEEMDAMGTIIEDRIATFEHVQEDMRRAQAAVEARRLREERLIEFWLERPVAARTPIDVAAFYDWVLEHRRELLPQSPWLPEVVELLAPWTYTWVPE